MPENVKLESIAPDVAELMFGEDGPRLLETTHRVLEEALRGRAEYKFMERSEYERLCKTNFERAQQVLLTELLYRAHFAAIGSLMRSYRWAQGMATTFESQLFLPYCANLRGLIESAADAAYSLYGVSFSLARSSAVIRRILIGATKKVILDAEEVEARLVHFTEARRIEKGASKRLGPLELEWAKAKETAYYIESAFKDIAPDQIDSLYKELCEFAHPAADSVCVLFVREPDGSLRFRGTHDADVLRQFAVANIAKTELVLRSQVNLALLMLGVLRHLPLESLHVSVVSDKLLSGLTGWPRHRAALSG